MEHGDTALWRFFFAARPAEEEAGFRAHYQEDDIRQVVAILSFVVVFMIGITVIDLVSMEDELPQGLLIRSGFMIIGIGMIWFIHRVRQPWVMDLAATVYGTVIAVGLLYFHMQGGASVERGIAIVTLFVFVAHLAFPTYTVFLTPSVGMAVVGESYLLTSDSSPVYTPDATVVILAMFASLGFAALGSALRQRSRYNAYRAMRQVKTLSGLIPICASCKKIRDDDGFYTQLESYITEHSQAEFSHGLCPECADEALKEASA